MQNTIFRLTPLGVVLFIILLTLVIGIGITNIVGFQYLNQRLDSVVIKPTVCEFVIKPTPTLSPTLTSKIVSPVSSH